MSMRSLLCCSSALFLAIQISSAVRQDVKIVVGKKINRDDKAQSSSSSTTSSTPTQPTPSRDPAAFDSSDVFSGIFGQCFEKEQGDYVYTFCPLKNFTQKNLPSHYSPNTYILGIWGTWTEGDKDIHPEYSYLHLNDGTECTPSLKRSISIYVECIPYEELVAPAQQAVPTATSTQTTGDSASSSATADILVPGTDPPSSSPEQGTPSIETPTETRTCAEDDNTCHADSTGNSGALDTSNTRNNDNSVTLNSVKSTGTLKSNVKVRSRQNGHYKTKHSAKRYTHKTL